VANSDRSLSELIDLLCSLWFHCGAEYRFHNCLATLSVESVVLLFYKLLILWWYCYTGCWLWYYCVQAVDSVVSLLYRLLTLWFHCCTGCWLWFHCCTGCWLCGFIVVQAVDSVVSLLYRLLTLWFEHGEESRVYDCLVKGLSTVKIENWLQVIPQLIARIDTNRQRVGKLILTLLCDIGKHHPQVHRLHWLWFY